MSVDVLAALGEFAERYGLDNGQHRQLHAVLTELARDPNAPTAVREPRGARDIHLADSLVGLEVRAVREADSLADIGAGAGFPGLALAVALARTHVRLIESQARKCAFIERTRASAEIENAAVIHARAEEWEEGMQANDVVVARALAAQPVVLEYAAPLLRLGGTLVDWRGRRNRDEEAAATTAASELGLHLVEVRHVQPYKEAREHHLHVYVKELPTPPKFPRRAGIARKRPLGAPTAPRADPDRR